MTSEDYDDADDRERVYRAMASRRKVLASTAAFGAAALAGCAGNGNGDGGTDTDTDMDGSMDEPTPTEEDTDEESMSQPDVDVLNYALTLEHLEYAFYRDGLDEFDDEQLRNADQVQVYGDKIRGEIPGRIETVRDHEKGHVERISTVVSDLGGEPVGEAEYTFEYESPEAFIETAMVLENTGVAAYKGAAPAIKNNDILSAALGIHSVEARHASFLNVLNQESPYPDAFDEAQSPEEVTEAANPFFQADIGGSTTMDDLEEDAEYDRKNAGDPGDLGVLNFALTLEHLENAFYRDGLDEFSDDEIQNADVLSEFGDEIQSAVPDRLRTVQEHEKAHVDAITSTVEELGGDPNSEAEYTFEYESPTKFIQTARVLENTGVAAYAGAGPTVENDDVLAAAASIHSVEARHAGFLNELNGMSPYPDAVDEAKSPSEVREDVQPFIEDS
ncbi:hypothetical protein BRC88_01675 [Halobacteriales archaeon QS_4_69_225]|nr:MAG: hypothetical protein BRC88_01675 [Halobacteriales archaeon QS_4_69_225]